MPVPLPQASPGRARPEPTKRPWSGYFRARGGVLVYCNPYPNPNRNVIVTGSLHLSLTLDVHSDIPSHSLSMFGDCCFPLTLDGVFLFPRWCRNGVHVVPRNNPLPSRNERRLQNLHKRHENAARPQYAAITCG